MRRESETEFTDGPANRDVHIDMWLRRGAAIAALLRSLGPALTHAVRRTRATRSSAQHAMKRLHQWAEAATHFKNRHA